MDHLCHDGNHKFRIELWGETDSRDQLIKFSFMSKDNQLIQRSDDMLTTTPKATLTVLSNFVVLYQKGIS